MPRCAKRYSNSGFYHVMVRGNGKQILFESDADRVFYITRTYFCFKDAGVKLLAWCIMDNHAHLLVLDTSDGLSTAMARINGAYALRYNSRNAHVGHVFQDRYLRKPIDDESYLLEVVRYIHNNPEEAHVCAAKDYMWSSYKEYVGVPRYADTELILHMLGGRRRFRQFCRERGDPKLRLRCHANPSPEILIGIAEDALAPVDPKNVAALDMSERNRCLLQLRDVGLTLKQIERITGIGKSTIHNAVLKAAAES